MWLRHWGLARDPFAGADSPYVPLAAHEEAAERLAFAVERRQRVVTMGGGPGLGKSTVIRRAWAEIRGPGRRAVLVTSPSRGGRLLGALADAMGLTFAPGADREGVWRSLARAMRASALEGAQIVLIVDGWDRDPGPDAMQDLLALVESPGPRFPPHTLVRCGREPGEGIDPDALTIGLERLTRSEAEGFLAVKLAAAGCGGRILTPRAIGRLHSWSEGVPRALEQIAALAMAAAANRGLEVVTPDVVDGVALRGLVGVDPSATSR